MFLFMYWVGLLILETFQEIFLSACLTSTKPHVQIPRPPKEKKKIINDSIILVLSTLFIRRIV
jgi:hypothetical protein